MKFWTLSIWDARGQDQNKINEHISLLETNDYEFVVLLCHLEVDFDFPGYPKLVEIIERKNIKVYAFIGTTSPITYYHSTFPYLSKNIEIIVWPTSFFRESLTQLIAAYIPQYNKFVRKLDDLEYKYHFVYLNNKSHAHRIKLMDTVAKHDLLKYSAYSWHSAYYNKNQEFKYYDGSVKALDERYVADPVNQQKCVPEEYYQSFFQLISETKIDLLFITEKTITPLILGKPFIVASVPGFHKFLEDLGFKLYDELFDYSFDTIENTEQRFEAICQNVKRITSISLDECRLLHSKIQDKVDHNRRHAINLAYDLNQIPKLAKDIIHHYYETGEKVDKQIIYTEEVMRYLKDYINQNIY